MDNFEYKKYQYILVVNIIEMNNINDNNNIDNQLHSLKLSKL